MYDNHPPSQDLYNKWIIQGKGIIYTTLFRALRVKNHSPIPQKIYWKNKSFIHQSPHIATPSSQSSLPAPWCPILLPLHRPVLPFRSQTNSHLGLARSGGTRGFHQADPWSAEIRAGWWDSRRCFVWKGVSFFFGDGTYRSRQYSMHQEKHLVRLQLGWPS